jgi:hypothetical protein
MFKQQNMLNKTLTYNFFFEFHRNDHKAVARFQQFDSDKKAMNCPAGGVQWSSRPPTEQKIPGSNPARVYGF